MMLSTFIFTEDEQVLVDAAWVTGKFNWSSKALVGVRKKIRTHFRLLLRDRCCYCRKEFVKDYDLAVDIEHVLPKSKWDSLAVNPLNLSVACKRCNMEIKSNRVDFLACASVEEAKGREFESDIYLIIHPNLDNYWDHLTLEVRSIDDLSYRRYKKKGGSDKAEATINYFRLRELEVNDLDRVQGMSVKDGTVAEPALRRTLEV